MARTSEAIRTSPRVKRLLGAIFVGASIVSLLVSIFAVYEVWSLHGRVSRSVDDSLALLSDTLSTSDRALANADDQLVIAQSGLATAEKATRNVSGSMGTTSDSLRTSSAIVGTELPATIRSTQEAVQNAQSSAKLIDNVLGTLAAIPLLGVDYRPAVPLNEQLASISRSLDNLPGLTSDLGTQINATATQLESAKVQTTTLADSLQKSQAGFAESRAAVAEFRGEVGQAKDLVTRARQQAPSAITWVAIGLTFVLAWLTVVQVAALLIGLDWLLDGR